MESGGIIRTIILTVLFVILVSDYTTLIGQLYDSVKSSSSSNESRGSGGVFVDGGEDSSTGESALDLLQGAAGFRDDQQGLELDADVDSEGLRMFGHRTRTEVISLVKNVCLPKMVCELSASRYERQLTENESALLKLISDTTLGTLAEVPSKYHYAAHMGQLISGTDGIGCHVFYSTCPLPGLEVMKLMKKLRIR